jgi:hypothetical protein
MEGPPVLECGGGGDLVGVEHIACVDERHSGQVEWDRSLKGAFRLSVYCGMCYESTLVGLGAPNILLDAWA